MNIKEINSKKLFKEFEIQIPYKDIDDSINDKINELIPTVSMPGFRKGKAPLNIVKKKYENNVLSEVIEKIVDQNTKKLIDEKKLKPFRQPKVELKKYEKNQPVEISIKIDLEPNIEVSPFEEIELVNRTIDVDKKRIDENYNQFINSQKHYHKVKDPRSAKMSDKIIANITTKDESVPEFLKAQNNMPIVTDSDYQILPDIGPILVNKKVKAGDKINLSFDLKEALKQKEKKEVEFEIEIVSLEHLHAFEITKEFLEKNNLKDEKQLKDNLEQNLINQYQDSLKQIQKKELMDILEKKNKFDIPEGILDEEFNSIMLRLDQAKKDNSLDEDDKNLSNEELKKRYKKIALRRVKLAILMQHIAGLDKITVTEKELTDGMLNYASQYPGQEKQIFDYFKKNPSSIETIRGPIFEQKIVDNIISKVKLKNEKIDIKKFEQLNNEVFQNKELK
ncbi:MAG: trigger factor [Alphaproteobacteria bacterium]